MLRSDIIHWWWEMCQDPLFNTTMSKSENFLRLKYVSIIAKMFFKYQMQKYSCRNISF